MNSEYKIIAQKSIVFLQSSNEQSKDEIKKTIPFTAFKRTDQRHDMKTTDQYPL